MPPNPDVRWQQRFQSFDRSLTLLRQALAHGPAALNPLEKEGCVQRFEVCLELAWKTAKDYLEHGGVLIVPVTPRQVVKETFAADLVADGQVWIDMLNHRNLLAHTFDCAVFEEAVNALADRYLPAIEALHGSFAAQVTA